MTLRLRLTVLYVVLLAAALGAFSVFCYFVASQRIYDGLDNALRIRSEAVIGALGPVESPLTAEQVSGASTALEAEAEAGSVFQIRDAEGAVLYSSLELVARNLPPPAADVRSEEVFTAEPLEGRRLRILIEPMVEDGRSLGSVEVAQSLSQTDDALNEIRNVLVLGGLGALVVTSATAFLLAGRALDPIRKLSRLARNIEQTADFSQRLAEQPTHGEIRELAGTLNAMIDRVEGMLEAQKDFLADSSHELRRPLAVLRANIDVLHDDRLPADERDACLSEMRAEAEKMARLLADLLLLSRDEGQAIEHEAVDLSALCDEMVAGLRSRDDGHELTTDIASGVQVVGDRERLAQMLGNLLDNSAQYTPPGGVIRVSLSRTDGRALLEVEDSGRGIAAGDRPHIFERFYRGEGARAARPDGSGLGLAIVRYIAEAHGGSVEVESQPGHGATFIVDLPQR